MAMNDDELLARAAGTLRAHTDDGWVSARGSVPDAVRSAVRPTTPVRGRLADVPLVVPFFVAAGVLVARLRLVVDAVPGVRLSGVAVRTDDDRLVGVQVRVAARFGTVLVDLAAAVRRAAGAELRAVLGDPALADALVEVDVHVEDVFPAPPEQPATQPPPGS